MCACDISFSAFLDRLAFLARLSFLLGLFSLLLAHLCQYASPFVTLAPGPVLVLVLVEHDAIELLIVELIAARLRNPLLELVNVFEIFTFLGVLGAHLVILECLVELFVFLARFVLFEGLDAGLLLQESLFDVEHVVVRLEHLGEKVIGSSDWYLGLDQELHALHHIVASHVVQADLAFYFILDWERLRYHHVVFASYTVETQTLLNRCSERQIGSLLIDMCSVKGMCPCFLISLADSRRL